MISFLMTSSSDNGGDYLQYVDHHILPILPQRDTAFLVQIDRENSPEAGTVVSPFYPLLQADFEAESRLSSSLLFCTNVRRSREATWLLGDS